MARPLSNSNSQQSLDHVSQGRSDDLIAGAAERKWYVYVLIDPRNGVVRYVGWTVDPKTRLRDHAKPSRLVGRQRRDKWIAGLVRDGLMPLMKIVESGSGDHVEAERRWITHHRDIGDDLTNHTDGGEGAPGRRHTVEAKASMSAKRRGRKPSPQALEAARRATKGKARPPEVVQAIRAALLGRPKSPEHCRKLAMAKSGRRLSEGHRAKLKAAAARKSPEVRQQSARKAAAASKALADTLERRIKISEGRKRWWASLSPEDRSLYMSRIRRAKNDHGIERCEETPGDYRGGSILDGDSLSPLC